MQELEGFFILKGPTFYSATQPREGLACVIAVDVTHWHAPVAQEVTLTFESRNRDGGWSTAATVTIDAAGIFTGDVTGIKELWRVSYVVVGGSSMTVAYLACVALSWRPW